MSEAARDLYSFLRSKDFLSKDSANADTDDAAPRLRSVDAFDDTDAQRDASNRAARDSAPEGAGDAPDNGAAAHNADAASPDLAFDRDDVGDALREANADTLDRAPFGVIRVDDDGVVQFFNQYESDLSGIAPEAALGKNFFTELAPCSNNRLFRGRFKKGLRADELDERFTYTYTYKMRPTLVDVRMYRNTAGQNWILVQKR